MGFTWSSVGSSVIIALIDNIPGLKVLAEDQSTFLYSNCPRF